MNNLKIKIYFTIIALSFFIQLPANNKEKNPFVIAEQQMGDSLNYLGAIKSLLYLKSDLINSNPEMYFQAALTYNAFIQNNTEQSSIMGVLPQYNSLSNQKIEVTDTEDNIRKYINEQAKLNQILIINEIHWFTKERYFTHSLLQNLYNLGYRYLALEALTENPDFIMQRGYAIHSSGFYTKDPQMSNMIRTAIKLGFKLIKYDSFDDTNREYAQAQNIYEQVLRENPSAKIIIHAGGDHINKCPERKKMAFYLKELSGITPYTIRQTKQLLIAKTNFKGLSIIEYNTGECHNNLQIINGIQESEFRINPFSKQYEVAFKDLLILPILNADNNNKLLLSIYIKEEYDKFWLHAIPVGNYLLNSNLYSTKVYLPKGEYITIIRNERGERLKSKKVAL